MLSHYSENGQRTACGLYVKNHPDLRITTKVIITNCFNCWRSNEFQRARKEYFERKPDSIFAKMRVSNE